MPPFGPIKRDDLIRALKQAGYEGPFKGGRHMVMIKGTHRLAIPNPHAGAIGRELLGRVLQQAGLTRGEWEQIRL